MLTILPSAFPAGLAQRTVLDSGATLLLSERNELPMAIVTILLKSGASQIPRIKRGFLISSLKCLLEEQEIIRQKNLQRP